ncbi:hypothetical protein TNCV_3058481 [Trichonephila clavipes]|nr:hypothetical protein TNCV_3058481 [Trichonephila clavipes]
MSTKFFWELNARGLRQTDHLTGTSDHAPQGPRSRILSWAQRSRLIKIITKSMCLQVSGGSSPVETSSGKNFGGPQAKL